MEKKFLRIPQKGWLGGICAGLAYSIGLEVWLVRLFVFIIGMSTGVGFIVYLLVYMFAPVARTVPVDYEERCEDTSWD